MRTVFSGSRISCWISDSLHWNSRSLSKNFGRSRKYRRSMRILPKLIRSCFSPLANNKELTHIVHIPTMSPSIRWTWWGKSSSFPRRSWRKQWASRTLSDTTPVEVSPNSQKLTAHSKFPRSRHEKLNSRVWIALRPSEHNNRSKWPTMQDLEIKNERWTIMHQAQLSIAKWILSTFKRWNCKCSKCNRQKMRATRSSTTWGKRRRSCSSKSRPLKTRCRHLMPVMASSTRQAWAISRQDAKVKLDRAPSLSSIIISNKWSSWSHN